MPEYEFGPCDNGNCPDRRGKATFYVIQYRMGDAPRIGERRECPCCGQGAITRLASLPFLIVKEADGRKTIGNRFVTNLAGRETHLQFIDHRHTDPHHESAMLEAAQTQWLKGRLLQPTAWKGLRGCPEQCEGSPWQDEKSGRRGRGDHIAIRNHQGQHCGQDSQVQSQCNPYHPQALRPNKETLMSSCEGCEPAESNLQKPPVVGVPKR